MELMRGCKASLFRTVGTYVRSGIRKASNASIARVSEVARRLAVGGASTHGPGEVGSAEKSRHRVGDELAAQHLNLFFLEHDLRGGRTNRGARRG